MIFFCFWTLDTGPKKVLGPVSLVPIDMIIEGVLDIRLEIHINMQRFRGGLVFKAHGLLYHSTLGLRVIKKKRRLEEGRRDNRGSRPPESEYTNTARGG